jgi:hypothetical protein
VGAARDSGGCRNNGGREAGKEELVGEAEEAGGVEMEQQEELAGQNKELERLALVDQQTLVGVVDADDPRDKEATEVLPTIQPKTDERSP